MRKKFFLIMLIAVFITAFAYSQKITVTNPHSGAKWYKGHTYTITWTKSGAMNANVKIRLYKGGSKVLGITDKTENNGSFTWKVPTNLPDGNYVIRVKTLDNHVFNDSNIFAIAQKVTPAGTITIISPHSGDEWQKGKTYNIKWNKTGNMNSNVKIILYQSSAKILDIINITPNSGSFMWSIPKSLPEGFYTMKVITIDNQVSGNSNSFKISSKSLNIGNYVGVGDISKNSANKKIYNNLNSGSTIHHIDTNKKNIGKKLRFLSPIKVMAPLDGERLWEGKTYKIMWEIKGLKGDRFSINLVDSDDRKVAWIKTIQIPASEKEDFAIYKWKVPYKLFKNELDYLKKYRIRIKTVDGGNKGYSGYIKILFPMVEKEYKIIPSLKWAWERKTTDKKRCVPSQPYKNEEFYVGDRVYWENGGFLKDAHIYKKDYLCDILYRGEAIFLLSPDLSHRPIIKKAYLHYKDVAVHGRTAIRVYKIKYQKDDNDLFGADIEEIAPSTPLNVSYIIREELRKGSKYVRFLFTGRRKKFTIPSGRDFSSWNISRLKDIYLIVKTTERKTSD